VQLELQYKKWYWVVNWCKLLGDLIDEITKQMYATPCGPTQTGPTNVAAFKAIKGKLNKN